MPPNNSTPKKRPSKTTWIWITVCFLIFFSPVIAFTAYRIHNKVTWEAKMESYLQNKYKQQFDVTNFRREGGGIGMPGQGTADAYAIDNDKMKFEVGEAGGKSGSEFYDTYIEVRWTKEATQEATSAVRSVFNGEMPWLEVEAHPISKVTGEHDRTSNLYDDLPTFKAQMQKDPEAVYYEIFVRTSGTLDANNKAEHTRRIHELAKLVSKQPSGRGSVRYVITHPTEDSGYYCQLNSLNSSVPFVYSDVASKIDDCLTPYKS